MARIPFWMMVTIAVVLAVLCDTAISEPDTYELHSVAKSL